MGLVTSRNIEMITVPSLKQKALDSFTSVQKMKIVMQIMMADMIQISGPNCETDSRSKRFKLHHVSVLIV